MRITPLAVSHKSLVRLSRQSWSIFRKEALKAASAQRDEVVPLFLDEIETYLALETCRSGETDAALLRLSSARGMAGEGRL